MIDLINQILFDKYLVLQCLGTGSFGQVFKVRHISLDQIRAIKIVPHDPADSGSKFNEAMLLKSITYPGIPRIYDVYEDDDYYYIVEEFIPGQSLDKFLLHQSNISIGLFFNICEQLCNIFIYLHSFKPLPIVYRDLKPEHIILDGYQIYLIDFGISNFASCHNASTDGNDSKSYGNLQFSAPENYELNTFTTHSDIYSVGKLIEYLLPFVDRKISRKFTHIIQNSTNPNPALRYETVVELLSDIQKNNLDILGPHPCKTVAVIGSNRGCGVTHLCFSLVTELNYLGYKAIYKENNHSKDLQNCALYLPDMYEKEGILKYHLFQGIPEYGPGISVKAPDNAISIIDYGTEYTNSHITDSDFLIIVCGGAYWNICPSIRLYNYFRNSHIKPFILINSSHNNISRTLAKTLEAPVYSFSDKANPFSPSKGKRKLLLQITNEKGEALLSKKRKRYFQKK